MATEEDCSISSDGVKNNIKLNGLDELATEDLARSGLTTVDIAGFEVLDAAAARRVLRLEGTFPARGGYAIPYHDLYGKPVVDAAGQPFVRVKLLDRLDDKAPRYMSPAGSGGYVY
ncbi:MAG: hypothetical protein K0041_07560, partial [Acidithiobacillus sp.]|nr:hypothetical protein [Acidithiobacillus sp.]